MKVNFSKVRIINLRTQFGPVTESATFGSSAGNRTPRLDHIFSLHVFTDVNDISVHQRAEILMNPETLRNYGYFIKQKGTSFIGSVLS